MSKQTQNNRITERLDASAKEITMYREKLLENVENITKLFDYRPSLCRICSTSESSSVHQSGDEDSHEFKGVIAIEIDYKSKKPFIDNLDETFYLAIRGGDLVASRHDDDEEDSEALYNLELEVIHHMIKTNAIPAFFEELAEVLDKTSKEYREVVEISEKLMNALK